MAQAYYNGGAMNIDAYTGLLYVMLAVAAIVFIGTFLISVVGVFKR